MAPDAAATFKVVESGSGLPGPFFFYQEAMDEHANPGHVHGSSNFSTLRHARSGGTGGGVRGPSRRAGRGVRAVGGTPGERVHGFVAGEFLTDLPGLPEEGG
jgi:hypothetical protein